MKRHGNFWKNLKPLRGKMEREDTIRLRRFFQLLKNKQDKIKPVPSPDFYNRVTGSLQDTEASSKDRLPYLSYRQRAWPWALVTAMAITIIVAIYSFRVPLSPKLKVDDALFVLTPEVVVLESLSETVDADSNGQVTSVNRSPSKDV